MLRQAFQDGLMVLQITGSVTTAVLAVAAPLALHALRR
jgi:hypothetical protein